MALCVIIGLFGTGAVEAAGSGSGWIGFQGGPAHLGAAIGVAPEPAVRLRTIAARVKDQGRCSGAVRAGDVWVCVSRTRFDGFDMATGTLRWSVARNRGTVLTPAFDPGTDEVVATEGTT